MKIFWSWQSDIEPNISMRFIKKCIENAIKELSQEALFSDREVVLDHDTKDVPGSPPIIDTIYNKIKESNVFIADITPVAKTNNDKKVMNPNVAIEMGYATAILHYENIITVMNNEFGNVDDLPFDLKHKRGPILFSLNLQATKEEISTEGKKLSGLLKVALRSQKNTSIANKVTPNFDLYGPAIYFDIKQPLLRTEGDLWTGLNDQPYYGEIKSSYIYVKITPDINSNLTKVELKNKLYNQSQFKIPLLYGSPNNTPIANKYGVILAKFDNDSNKKIVSDFVQTFTNGSIVSISNSLLHYTKNKIYLTHLYHCMKENVSKSLDFIQEFNKGNFQITIELGIVNGDNCTVIRPNPKGNMAYFDTEIGPLEQELYSEKILIGSEKKEQAEVIVNKLISQIMDDIGIEFKREDHEW